MHCFVTRVFNILPPPRLFAIVKINLYRYGKAVTAAKTRAITTAPLYPQNPGPHARFIFRYRTLGE